MIIADISSLSAIAAILVPFAISVLIIVCPQPAAKGLSIFAAALATVLSIAAWAGLAVSGGQQISLTIAALGQAEILGLVLDKTSVMLATCFVSIGLLIAIYSVGYLNAGNREHPDVPRRRFYAFFTIFIGAMAGLAYSSTLVGQLVFFEITGVCSWALIGYYGTKTAQGSAMKALVVTHLASLALYIAVAVLYLQTGTFAISAIASLDDAWKTFVLVAILIAAWGKSAQLPFYMWLPSAMEAPTPVSAYLHGASMVKVGVAIVARALAAAGAIPEAVGWVAVICAILTMVFSFVMYLPQKDMKRLLAFSTISQLSYVFLGFAFFIFGSELAFEGGLMHMFNHAFAKTLFFLVAGAFSYCMGTRMLPQIKGVMKKQPLLAVSFTIAALAIAGVPPFNGFFSKFAIFSGSFAVADSWPLLLIVVIALVETVGCFAWFLKWIGSVALGEPSEVVAGSKPVPKAMASVFVILIIMTVLSSFIAASWLG